MEYFLISTKMHFGWWTRHSSCRTRSQS